MHLSKNEELSNAMQPLLDCCLHCLVSVAYSQSLAAYVAYSGLVSCLVNQGPKMESRFLPFFR